MNKDNIKKICSVLLYVAVFITFTGCEEFADEQSFQTVTVKQQRIRKIETLDLDSFKAPEQEVEIKTETEPKDTLEMTIEQCRAITLENNLDLKVQLINPTIASEGVNQEEARFEALF